MTQLVLASESVYRKQLLQRLRVPFACMAPHLDETAEPEELPHQLATRLAREKAQVIAKQTQGAVIIGSDQVCACGADILGKPGNQQLAQQQLMACSGRAVMFFTALYVFDQRTEKAYNVMDTTEVVFRQLSTQEIQAYLRLDEPYDCAGSFKVEQLGVTLFNAVNSQDPTALIGLPLIQLGKILRRCGINPLGSV